MSVSLWSVCVCLSVKTDMSVCLSVCLYHRLQGESRNRGNDEIVVRVFNKYKASNIGEQVEWCGVVDTTTVVPLLVCTSTMYVCTYSMYVPR